MHRFTEFLILFIVVLLLQALLFNNLNFTMYITPLVYVAVIALLPMETPSIVSLLVGLAVGVASDLLMGTAGLNTIASLFTAMARKPYLALVLNKEEYKDGGIPLASRIGTLEFLKYTSLLVVAHCVVFFIFETLSWRHIPQTLVKIVASSTVTVILVYFSQLMLPSYYNRSKNF